MKRLNKDLYVDMDGVLAWFSKKEKALDRFETEEGFFKDLLPISNNYELVNALAKEFENVFILSASPNKQADRDKVEWLKKYIPNIRIANIKICRLGEDKSLYMRDVKNSVLIDDHTPNLVKIKMAGATGIKYINTESKLTGTYKNHNIVGIKNFYEIVQYVA